MACASKPDSLGQSLITYHTYRIHPVHISTAPSHSVSCAGKLNTEARIAILDELVAQGEACTWALARVLGVGPSGSTGRCPTAASDGFCGTTFVGTG